jgi:ribose-phosphate pyrophosphokinase
MNLIGDVEGKNVLLRDDMVDTGGSICQAAHYCKERGALEVYAACTHGVLSGSALEKIEKSPIKRFVICDSIDQSQKKLSDKFEVLTCSELIGEAIKRIFEEQSVSSLFEETAPVKEM